MWHFVDHTHFVYSACAIQDSPFVSFHVSPLIESSMHTSDACQIMLCTQLNNVKALPCFAFLCCVVVCAAGPVPDLLYEQHRAAGYLSTTQIHQCLCQLSYLCLQGHKVCHHQLHCSKRQMRQSPGRRRLTLLSLRLRLRQRLTQSLRDATRKPMKSTTSTSPLCHKRKRRARKWQA